MSSQPLNGKSVLLATRNAKKLGELRRILEPLVSVQVLGLDDVPTYEEVPETGATFEENALLKAREGAMHTGLITVADDSGLQVDALNGMPGVLSARWSGAHGEDRANLELVLAQLGDTPDDRRGASFACAAALVTPAGDEHVEVGLMTGRLLREPVGTNGFGYDPIFVPDASASDRSSAELSAAEKDAISHRSAALRALLPQLLAYLK